MKLSGGPASFNIKVILLLLGLAIAASTLIYTQYIVGKLQERDRQIVELYAESFNYIADYENRDTDLTFIFENIIQRIDFPLILTDANDHVHLNSRGGGIKNLEIDSTLTFDKKLDFINKKIRELSEINPPIPVTFNDSLVLNKIYYGDSEMVKQLRYYPYLQIIFALAFILIAYLGFSYLKRSEQSNIWVGMAKETAHQLGTPLSSLMGWTEILQMHHDKSDRVLDAVEEINSDLTRLNKVAQRFSKIGSKPELKQKNIYDALQRVINYFQRRLPQTGKTVDLTLTGNEDLSAKINIELFEWVIENLTKNALDAIENKNGLIEYNITESNKYIEIEVSDNGKGIDLKKRRDIFRPGYSTKRRGWGLGLSLSKRIIEDYHDGKIFVKHSVLEEGTIFKIMLRKENE